KAPRLDQRAICWAASPHPLECLSGWIRCLYATNQHVCANAPYSGTYRGADCEDPSGLCGDGAAVSKSLEQLQDAERFAVCHGGPRAGGSSARRVDLAELS